MAVLLALGGIVAARVVNRRQQRPLALIAAPAAPVALLPAPAAVSGTLAAPAASAQPAARPLGVFGNVSLQVWAVMLALIGGALGIGGAFLQEFQTSVGPAGLLMIFIGAPMIEEALKPSGVYLLLLEWPRALHGRLHIALLCALSGLVFGFIESWVYVNIYIPDASHSLILYRYTVTPLIHATGSFLVGMGLSHQLIDWAAGRVPLPKRTRNFYLSGFALHASYNTIVTIISVLGVISFS